MLPSCSQCGHRSHADQPCPARFAGYGEAGYCQCGHAAFFGRLLRVVVSEYVPDDSIIVASVDPTGRMQLAMVQQL